MIIKFYNDCITCGRENIILVKDTNHEISKAGGVRAFCPNCGRNTKPQVWNEFNPKEETQERV